MDLTMTPTLWLIIGLALMFMELLTPGFVIFFFGLSAITVSLLSLLIPSMGMGWEFGLFSVFSIFYVVILRKWVKSVFAAKKEKEPSPENEAVGQRVRVIKAICPPAEGRVELFGAEWKAVSEKTIPAGAIARIVSRDNLTLTVEPLASPQQ